MNSLLFTQIRVKTFNIWLRQQQLILIVILLSHSFAYTIIIVQLIFITDIFKPQLFSSHATCLHTRLTEFFVNGRCLLCLAFYIASSQMNALEAECLCLCEISINLNIMFTLLLFVYFAYVCPCRVVVACLLLYTLFIILMLLVHFCCLFAHVNKPIIFVF